MQAVFHYGEDPTMVPYTPGSAVSAGDVVVVGSYPFIAHRSIAANDLGALAVSGGVYTCTGDAAISAGKKVYWDNTNKKVTETATSNTPFGFTVVACTGNGAAAEVYHDPCV